jgi:hypothetical protein
MKVIKMSCGGQGCEINPYYAPMGIVKEIKKPVVKSLKLVKAA